VDSRIVEAIEHRLVLSFEYNGSARVVEPHAYGIGATGEELLRAWQVNGDSSSESTFSWKLFKIAKIAGLSVGKESFGGGRPGYRANDQSLVSIFAQR